MKARPLPRPAKRRRHAKKQARPLREAPVMLRDEEMPGTRADKPTVTS